MAIIQLIFYNPSSRELKALSHRDDTIYVSQGNNNKFKGKGMSIKVTGTPPIRPSTDQSKRVNKSGANFEDSLKTNEAPKVKSNSDSVKLTGPVANNPSGYQQPLRQVKYLDGWFCSGLKSYRERVLTSDVEANKEVTGNQGYDCQRWSKAYLDSVDSEKVAQRLLNSGILDDIL